MNSIRMISLEDLWKNLNERERRMEIMRIHLNADEPKEEINAYYKYMDYEFHEGDQTPVIELEGLVTAFFVDAPKRAVHGAPVIIFIYGKNVWLWHKQRNNYFYLILEIITPKKGNSILKLRNKYSGKVFYTRIPRNWDVVNDTLGLLRS